jgi:CubicO group peptidase (beta-lactamase class C family)
MKKILLFTLLSISASIIYSQPSLYPSPDWEKAKPQEYGYDAAKLEDVHRYIVDSLKTSGLMVIVGGKSIFEYGSTTRISYIASCRKSVLAMMYGKYIENGTIDPSLTMEQLGIDDIGGLLPIEKRATIKNLITSRSGVYHDASNGGDDAESRPVRGSKEPGEYFLYNNWDFNVAGEVFEMLTGKNIYEAFMEDIAIPTGMQDYELLEQKKGGNLKISKYPPYHFYFSTRDMARIGYLMLRRGRWGDLQVISQPWIDEIVRVITPVEEMNPPEKRTIFEYGYMWWLFKIDDNPAFANAYTARGAMGQYITVFPARDMVIAHKTDSVYERRTTWDQYYKLLTMIIEAKK